MAGLLGFVGGAGAGMAGIADEEIRSSMEQRRMDAIEKNKIAGEKRQQAAEIAKESRHIEAMNDPRVIGAKERDAQSAHSSAIALEADKRALDKDRYEIVDRDGVKFQRDKQTGAESPVYKTPTTQTWGDNFAAEVGKEKKLLSEQFKFLSSSKRPTDDELEKMASANVAKRFKAGGLNVEMPAPAAQRTYTHSSGKTVTWQQIEATAKNRGLTTDQVIQQLDLK